MDACLRVLVQAPDLLIRGWIEIPGMRAVSRCDEHSPAANARHALGGFLEDGPILARVAPGPAVLQVDPRRIPEVARRPATLVDDAEPLEEGPHPVVHLVAELLADADVILEGRREIRQHRVVPGRQRHEVGRVGRHHLIEAPAEIVERHVHVQRRTDVEPDGQPVQLAHRGVLETDAHELLPRAEDLGADEAGHVVHVHPWFSSVSRGRARPGYHCRKCPREPVLAGLVDDHVEALAMAVGGVGALARFEVHPERSAARRGVAGHAGDVDAEHGVGVGHPAEALKPERRGAGEPRLGGRLHVDVREDAVRHHLLEAEGGEHVTQRELDRGYTVHVARNRVRAEHDIADGVGPAVEHLHHDVLGRVGRRVGLDARAHVAARPDPRPRQRVEDRSSDHREIGVRHQLDGARDHVARQARHDGLDCAFRPIAQEPHQLAERPSLDAATGIHVHAGIRECHDLVIENRVRQQRTDGGIRQQSPRVLARALIRRRQPLQRVALLERVRGAQQVPVFSCVEATVYAVEPAEEILPTP